MTQSHVSLKYKLQYDIVNPPLQIIYIILERIPIEHIACSRGQTQFPPGD